MSINPFDFIKNSSAIQTKLNELESKIHEVTATGESGGGLVKITLNGKFECLAITLDPVAVDNRDIPMLQTLIKSAHHDAVQKIGEKLKAEALSNGLGDFSALTNLL